MTCSTYTCTYTFESATCNSFPPPIGQMNHEEKIAKLPKVIRRNGQMIYLR